MKFQKWNAKKWIPEEEILGQAAEGEAAEDEEMSMSWKNGQRGVSQNISKDLGKFLRKKWDSFETSWQ